MKIALLADKYKGWFPLSQKTNGFDPAIPSVKPLKSILHYIALN